MDLREAVEEFGIRPLLEAFHAATGVPLSLMDRDGEFVVTLGWQRICTEFHRGNPASEALCRQSDRTLVASLQDGGYSQSCCPLGLVDIAFPVVVQGQRLGTVFTGQFLYAPADQDRFRGQAERFGFDSDAYLAALAEVRVADERDTPELMRFPLQLVGLLTELIADREARQRAERQLIEADVRLERKVEERTRDINDALAALAEEAAHDHLTGLLNRRYMSETLAREIARARRSGSPLAVLLIDMDGLKDLNDRFGHGTGDRAIRAVGAAMSQRLRNGDILGRWGGDEFCAILADTPLRGAATVAERLRAGVAADLNATISVGVAQWTGEDAAHPLHRADDALYLAKRDGRNRCRVHLRPRDPAGHPVPKPAGGVPAAGGGARRDVTAGSDPERSLVPLRRMSSMEQQAPGGNATRR